MNQELKPDGLYTIRSNANVTIPVFIDWHTKFENRQVEVVGNRMISGVETSARIRVSGIETGVTRTAVVQETGEFGIA